MREHNGRPDHFIGTWGPAISGFGAMAGGGATTSKWQMVRAGPSASSFPPGKLTISWTAGRGDR